ncbi:MAG: PIN domain-containing protein [Thermoleophilaceae bacterium]|nr:PIN domain-containing protein [Thermoleophilaceae bacterium]
MSGLLDTSVFVARETSRPLKSLPDEGRVSVVTVAELRIGVLIADDPSIRAQRLRTLSEVEALEPLPVDEAAARAFAEIAADGRRRGKRPKILDALIAATAVSRDMPVYTQDADFEDMADVQVVRV